MWMASCNYFPSLIFFLPGGHENFAKMIDEAEVLEFPMVVKNTRGHRGEHEEFCTNVTDF